MTVSLEKVKHFLGNKTVRIVLICLAALILLLVSFKVFAGGGESKTGGYAPTAEEARLIQLLTRIEGVDDATVMITEEEGVAVGAVVIFEGKDGFVVRMRVMEIAAVALGIDKSAVLVYPSGL